MPWALSGYPEAMILYGKALAWSSELGSEDFLKGLDYMERSGFLTYKEEVGFYSKDFKNKSFIKYGWKVYFGDNTVLLLSEKGSNDVGGSSD